MKKDYYNLYIKYKNKYLNIKNMNGGSKSEKTIDIIKFLQKSTFEEIQTKLLDIIFTKKYCINKIGEGMAGIIYTPNINSKEKIKMGKKIIELPIVVKEAKKNNELFMDIIDNKLYIYSSNNITLEMLILNYINKLYYKKKSPHLPLMIGYSCCFNNKEVDTIITERFGLDKKIEIAVDGINFTKLFFDLNMNTNIFSSYINTLDKLITYIMLKKNDNDEVILPNGIKCDIIELIDYICISYIHTYNLLNKNNIYCNDSHNNNIFIQWLTPNSWFTDININNIKYINYKIGNKIYKIKTFGFIIKLGDVGNYFVKPRKDIYILGIANDIINNYKIIDQNKYVDIFIFILFNFDIEKITYKLYQKIIIYQIINTYPYNEISLNRHFTIKNEHVDKLLKPYELLNFYEKYEINKIERNKYTLIINEY